MKLVACVLAIRPSDGSVLAVSRPRPPLRWGLPGGGVDPGESFAEAAARELYEETGLKARRLRQLVDALVSGNTRVVCFEGHELYGKVRSSEEGLAAWLPPHVLAYGEQAAFPAYTQRVFEAARMTPR